MFAEYYDVTKKGGRDVGARGGGDGGKADIGDNNHVGGFGSGKPRDE